MIVNEALVTVGVSCPFSTLTLVARKAFGP